MAKLLVSKSTVCQTAVAPGATGGGFDPTVCGALCAQAASKEITPTAASCRHETVHRDISVSILFDSRPSSIAPFISHRHDAA
jgi:hypothetical protein